MSPMERRSSACRGPRQHDIRTFRLVVQVSPGRCCTATSSADSSTQIEWRVADIGNVDGIDTETRPAVFYKLSTLEAGETIRVVRDDGKVAEFTIDDVEVVQRDRFDARHAYGTRASGRAELRLITCGGTFDRASRSYTANVIVSAYLTGTESGTGR
ncbi:hypothetical protein SAURM35S_09045 [Streptomyces aurantiogriseus]